MHSTASTGFINKPTVLSIDSVCFPSTSFFLDPSLLVPLHLIFSFQSLKLRLSMALISRTSYQRLRQEVIFDDDEELHLRFHHPLESESGIRRSRSSWYWRKRVHNRRRSKIRIPGLRKFLKRKARAAMAAWTKVVKRLKDSQSHFGDLFAGNYLFMQVTPTTSFKSSLSTEKKTVVGHYGVSALRYSYAI
ncbi:hypothetical protein Nepgr_008642 [Nepenthes gracilis]|uniref:Uncharacterized protein n=1 Tax=Nepenthes gracilis TaxID=150966 RepID=A0AAD3S9A3_NEPGR|nr:hypothetical protein Nepgr_008642 [Nepenthes gracilis]